MAVQEVDLRLQGMTCSACAARIEKVLNRADGVSAAVNFASETAHVAFDAARTPIPRLIDIVRQAGYDAVVQTEPGAADDEAPARLAREWREFVWAAALTLPLVVPMVFMFAGRHDLMLPAWLQFTLATPVQFLIGRRFYLGAWHALRGGAANMDVLVALGTSVAFVYSTAVWLLPISGQHLYFEASATVITLVLLGKLLEARAKARTGAALASLLGLQPRTAVRERAGLQEEVPIAALLAGDVFVIRAGESVAVDGEVIDGESGVDEAMLTGESAPVWKVAGARVLAGTVNQNGVLRARATAVGQATLLAGIVRQVAAAQGSKAPVQRQVDRIAAWFVPAVVGIALITFAATLAFTGEFAVALIRATAVLVIACPCALGLATPTALMVGVGRAAQAGILIRNADALERARNIDVLLVDKTGTLTRGQPAVVAVRACPGIGGDDLVALAAGLEQGATHPLARAIQAHARQRGIAAAAVTAVTVEPGRGVRGQSGGVTVALGSPRFVAELGVDVGAPDGDPVPLSGNTAVVVVRGNSVVGRIHLADEIRPTSAGAVAALRRAGIEVEMLTGDNAQTANAVARAVGIAVVHAGALPGDKLAVIESHQRAGRVVAMAGDGVNDAPALARADVSFAMGSAAGSALQAADVTLLRNDLAAVVESIELSRRTLAKIRQNLFFAFVYNVAGIPLAALGWLSPVFAGAAMAMSSVSVVTNSLLLGRWRPAVTAGAAAPLPPVAAGPAG